MEEEKGPVRGTGIFVRYMTSNNGCIVCDAWANSQHERGRITTQYAANRIFNVPKTDINAEFRIGYIAEAIDNHQGTHIPVCDRHLEGLASDVLYPIYPSQPTQVPIPPPRPRDPDSSDSDSDSSDSSDSSSYVARVPQPSDTPPQNSTPTTDTPKEKTTYKMGTWIYCRLRQMNTKCDLQPGGGMRHQGTFWVTKNMLRSTSAWPINKKLLKKKGPIILCKSCIGGCCKQKQIPRKRGQQPRAAAQKELKKDKYVLGGSYMYKPDYSE